MYTKRRTYKDFGNNVQVVMEAMCFDIKNAQLNGSASYRISMFPADYDLYEIVPMKFKNNSDAQTKISSTFQQIVKQLMSMKDVYIADIKWGEQNNKPIRWTANDVLNDKNDGIPLRDGVIQPAICKLDVIAFLDNVYTELSVIYEFKNNGKILNNVGLNEEESLNRDITDLENEGNYYKSAKRILSVSLFKNNKHVIEKLLELFNSNCGIVYQVMCNIKTLIFMLEHYHHLSFEKIDSEIDTMINRLSACYEIIPYLKDPNKYNTMLRQMEGIPNQQKYYKKFANKLHKIYNLLDSALQKTAKKYLETNNIHGLFSA